MSLILLVLINFVIAASLLGILITEGLLDFQFAWLDARRSLRARATAGVAGYIFLRNYKRAHLDRVEETIRAGLLTGNIQVRDHAFDSSGHELPSKIAVYASSNEVGELFFSKYTVVKAREKRLLSPVLQHA